MKILLVEDNLILSRNITQMLINDEIFTDVSIDWLDWLKKAMSKYYDIIILDVDLPWINGFEICKKIRESWKEVGIIMLTSMSWIDNIVDGLNFWADDYLTKPFEYKELFARIQVIKRRKMKNSSISNLKIKNIEINLETFEILKWKEKIKLSKIEFELLKVLAQNKWKALTRKELFELIWWESHSDFVFSRTLDVHIWNLRKKIWEDIIETKKWIWFIIN
jgi:DNA-binding response OmpR family regulator